MALSRLQDAHGYDLWWLPGRDAIDLRPWYFLFPVLTLATMALAVLHLFSPPVLPALFALLLVNARRALLTDCHICAVDAAFRQMAPVIAAGQKLAVSGGRCPARSSARFERTRRALRGLKTIARWISGDPFMLPTHSGPLAMLVNDVVTTIYEYLNLLFLLDANGRLLWRQRLRARTPALLRLVTAIGEIDCAISVASLREGRRDWTRPRFRAPGATAN